MDAYITIKVNILMEQASQRWVMVLEIRTLSVRSNENLSSIHWNSIVLNMETR